MVKRVRRVLPPDSEPWGREVDRRLQNIETTLTTTLANLSPRVEALTKSVERSDRRIVEITENSGVVTGDLLDINLDTLIGQVAVDGYPDVILPILPGDYSITREVQVLVGASGPELILGPVTFPTESVLVASVNSVNTSNKTASVNIPGYGNMTLPIVDGNYTNVQTVYVLLGLVEPEVVLGGRSYAAAPAPAPKPKPKPTPNPVTKEYTAVIKPTWSGTYRQGSGWDRWNANRYGGRSDLYQGSNYGSGNLTGLATYGNRITSLGADSIKSISVQLVSNNQTLKSYGGITLRGSSNGSQPGGAPNVQGASVTSSKLGRGKSVKVNLPASMNEAFRKGTIKGLATVGGSYNATRGTSHPNGMVLTIKYTVTE